MLDIHRENDPETLRSVCKAYETANRQLIETIRQLTKENAELRGLDASQVCFELPQIVVGEQEAEAPEELPEKPPRPPQRGHGPKEQPKLPIEEKIHRLDPPPECDLCGATMSEMGDQFEESEQITVAEASYKIQIHRRQKYRCRCNGKIVTAPAPPKLLAGGRYSPDFAIHAAVSKYCDHMPLERQVQRMSRHGLELSSQTLWDQVESLARHLEPSWEALGRQVLEEPVLHVDETGWRMMASKKNPSWTVWGLGTRETSWYQIAESKSTAKAEEMLGEYTGTLVVDGFAVYPKLQKNHAEDIQIAHCWAHVDRKFKDAKDPPEAIRKIRGLIHQLYEIERKLDGPFPGEEAARKKRLGLRQKKSVKVTKKIKEWAFCQGGLPRSSFGKAVLYLLKHWDGLTLFLKDPRIPLDNNTAERALRGLVVGRKNFYGNRSKRGARVASILYTLIETAKLRGLDPREYLHQAALNAIENPGAITLPE